MVKLDPAKVRWIIRQKEQGELSTEPMASELKELETPVRAFYRKLPPEMVMG